MTGSLIVRVVKFVFFLSYINKRIDTPGIMMANLFRQYYGKVVRDMKTMINKEIQNGFSSIIWTRSWGYLKRSGSFTWNQELTRPWRENWVFLLAFEKE